MKTLFPMHAGKVVMRCNDDVQKERIVKTVRDRNKDIEIREKESLKPRLIITGLLRRYNEDDLKEMILLENEDINVTFGQNFKEVGRRVRRSLST